MTVSSSIGPVSGIDYGKLIDGLIGLEQRPIDQLTTRIKTLDTQNTSFLGLSAMLTSLKVAATSFTSSTVFKAAAANSSNPGVLSANAGPGTPSGSYSFTVQRLASATQLVTQGFADATNTSVGTAGNLTFEFGKGNLDNALNLSQLNGGTGVPRGSIRVTDKSGSTATIDLSQAVDVNDVVKAINSASGINVTAAINGDHFTLTDNTGGSGTLSVGDIGSGTTAKGLGLNVAASGNTLTGSDVNKLALTTSLNTLNDGNGVRTSGILSDFVIHSSAGNLNVSLNGNQTLGDVIKSINLAGNVSGTQVITASLSADGHSLSLTDSGGGSPTVSALNGSLAAQDLGLTGTGSGGVLTGSRLNQGLNSALLADLNGGSSTLTAGRFTINGTTVDAAGAKTVNDVLAAINAANAGVTAGLNNAGTGVQLTSNTAGANITVADTTGNTAAFLGINQSNVANAINGGDLHLRYISNNTLLTTLNGGAGFKPGKFTLTDSTGKSFTVDASTPQDTTIGAIINKINNSNTGIRASVNSKGNGILLTDTAGGQLAAKVTEAGGSTAASLNILGAFTTPGGGGNQTLDGGFEKTVAILATDKLQDVVSKINTAGVGVAANIINDGSGATPFRLSLVSKNPGSAGNLHFDGSALGINTSTLVQGQDAVVLYGNGGAANAIQLTSTSNTLTGIVPGLTVNLSSTSSAPVTVSVTQDTSKITGALQTFVDAYNKVQSNLATLTKFDPANPDAKGVLFGDSTIQRLQEDLGGFFGKLFSTGSTLNNMAAVGVSVNQDGTLAFDSTKLDTALATNPGDVATFFTTPTTGVGDTINTILNRYTDAQNGLLFRATDSIATQEKQLNDRVALLNTLLADKKTLLTKNFANLEVNIAQLQQQGNAIGSFKATTTSSSSK